MAKGRFLSKKISADKEVNDFGDPWSMLAWTWAIAHLDKDGKIYGDPEMLRSIIFPRQRKVTAKMMESYIFQWRDAEKIIYYESKGDRFIQFLNFEKNQPGLRKEREPESDIPSFNPDNCRIIVGSLSEECTVKLSQVEVEEQLPSSPPVHVSPDDWKAEYSLNKEQYMEFEKSNTVLILNILLSVAGFYPQKRESDTVMKTIIHIAERHKIVITPKTSSQVADILRPYYLAWCKRKSKNGHPYSKTSLVWLLEWAAVGEIPTENIPKKDKLTVADVGQQLSKDEIRSMADDLRAAKKAREEKGIPVEIPAEVDA